jgi:hypothetical protein
MTTTTTGFRKPAKVYRLKFADEEFAGLEVKAKSVPLGTFLELSTLAEPIAGGDSREQVTRVSQLFAGFAQALISWNLEDEETGEAVPATYDGIMAQEFDFVLAIITAWMEAISGVAAPLANGSTSGDTTLEASLPMAPISPSPESSPTPN